MGRYREHLSVTEMFTTGSLESLLPAHSPARGIDAALGALDFSAFDAVYKNDSRGRLAINPRSITAVWVLAMLRGVTSSVRLAAVCRQDIEFRWLLGDVPVEKSTLCAFRKERKEELAALSTQVLAALAMSGQLPGKSVAVDGTIVRAAASVGQVRKRHLLERRLQKLRHAVDEKLSEPDPEVEDIEALQSHADQIEASLRMMDKMGLTQHSDSLTMTEPEASTKKLKGNAGCAPAHNVQVVSDAETGVIVHAEIVDAKNDAGQLAPQIDEAQAAIAAAAAGPLEAVAADSGYHDTEDLVALDGARLTTYVPNDRNEHRRPQGVSEDFTADRFAYDEASDTFACPAGKLLRRRKETTTAVVYKARPADCAACPFKHLCCPTTRHGRNINRAKHAKLLGTIAERTASDEGQTAAKKRRTTAEGIFARLKELLHWPRCRLFGRRGAEVELLWRQLAYNLMHLTGQWKPLVHTPKQTAEPA